MLQHMRHAVPLASLLVPFLSDRVWADETTAEEIKAVRLDVAYTGDILSNLQGGLARGTRYLDNLDVTLAIDGDRALGWGGAKIFVYGLYNNGTTFSNSLLGDRQMASNIETGVRAARLYEAWIDQTFANENASLRVGLYDMNSEFDRIEAGSIFINSAQGVGDDLAQTGKNGPSIFPYTSLAARFQVKLSDTLTVRAVVLDGVPGDPDHPKRTAIKLGQDDGALLIGELDYDGDHIRVVAGHWRYTASFDDQLTGMPRRGNAGVYGFVESRFDRLNLFARAGWANARINPVKYYVGAGAVYRAPLASRPDDYAGLAIAWSESGSPYRRLAGADAREVSVELTYRAVITEFLTLQPDVQYIFNPGFDPALKNALMFGLRFELAWGI